MTSSNLDKQVLATNPNHFFFKFWNFFFGVKFLSFWTLENFFEKKMLELWNILEFWLVKYEINQPGVIQRYYVWEYYIIGIT